MFSATTTMSLQEFLNQAREKEEMQKTIERKIMQNKKLKKLSVFVLANLLYCQKVLATTADMAKIDKAGMAMLGIIRTFGYWICIIMCIIEIIKSLTAGDTKNIGKIIAKYIIAFATFYFLPWMFDVIKDIFK